MPDAELPFVSVAITVKNSAHTVRECLAGLLALDYPRDRYEVIVVDGGSRDGTVAILREFESGANPPRVVVRTRPGNIPSGRNEGVRQARGEYVAMTDGDAVPEKDWLRNLVARRRANDIAVVGGPTTCASGDLGSRAVACLPIQGPTRDEVPLSGTPRYDHAFETDRFVYASVTRCCLFRKSALEAIGGFDETIGGTEDVDVNARLVRAGYRLAYTPDAVVRHHHRTRLRRFLRQQWIYALWQTVVMIKNPELRERKHALPALALVLFLGSIVLAAMRPGLWFLPAGAALAGLAAASAYGLRCATAKRDPALAAAVPPFFLLWMLAWAVGYPSGLVLARRVLGAQRPPAGSP